MGWSSEYCLFYCFVFGVFFVLVLFCEKAFQGCLTGGNTHMLAITIDKVTRMLTMSMCKSSTRPDLKMRKRAYVDSKPTALVHCPLPIAYCLLSLAHCLLLAAYCMLLTASCPLPFACCILPSVYCPLLIAHCIVPSAFRTWPIAYCLLPLAYCLQIDI